MSGYDAYFCAKVGACHPNIKLHQHHSYARTYATAALFAEARVFVLQFIERLE